MDLTMKTPTPKQASKQTIGELMLSTVNVRKKQTASKKIVVPATYLSLRRKWRQAGYSNRQFSKLLLSVT